MTADIDNGREPVYAVEHALFGLYVGAALFSYLTASIPVFRIAILAGLALLATSLIGDRPRWLHVQVNGLVYLVFVGLSAIVVGRAGIRELALAAGSIGVAMYVVRAGPPQRLVGFLALPVIGFIAWHMWIQSDPNYIFGWSSQNGVSVLGLLLCVLYYLDRARRRESVPLWPAAVVLVASIWANGRSGIAVGVLLFIGIAIYNGAWKWLVGAALAAASLLLNPAIAIQVSQQLLGTAFLGRFVQLGVESPLRAMVMDRYLERLDAKALFFGAHLQQADYLEFLLFNSHNSWLSLHALSGAYLLVFALLVGIAVISSWRTRPLLPFLIALLIVRFSTDSDLFVGLFDFVAFSLVFAAIGPLPAARQADAAVPRPVPASL